MNLKVALPLATAVPTLDIMLQAGTLSVRYAGQTVPLTNKWVVYYALMALHRGRYVSPDDLHDHHPWCTLKLTGIGGTVWRFTESQEPDLFGRPITTSPPKSRTKQFRLCDDLQVVFQPDRQRVAEHLQHTLPDHQGHTLGRCTLLLHSGQVQTALQQLQALQTQPLSINDQAQLESLITTCLDRLYGTGATASQLSRLEELLRHAGLHRLARANLLLRLARHHTLSANYPAAAQAFASLSRLLTPQDGVEHCQYHLNYGLYLRRQGDLTGAKTHTLMAHDAAQHMLWWYGVQAAQSNLALIHISLADQTTGKARHHHFLCAKEWAMRGNETVTSTLQGDDEADLSLLLCVICRELAEFNEARQWATQAIAHAARIPNQADLKRAYLALAELENKLGNHEAAEEARQQSEQATIHP